MKRIVWLLLLIPAVCRGQIITATLTLTNAVTNGFTISINGHLRTWTNYVTAANTQVQVPTNSPPLLGTDLVPNNASYDGSGQYAFTWTVGDTYWWTKGANDTGIVGGPTATGYFTPTTSSAALEGTANATVTASVQLVTPTLIGSDTTNLFLAFAEYPEPNLFMWMTGPNQIQFQTYSNGQALSITTTAFSSNFATVAYSSYTPTNLFPVMVPSNAPVAVMGPVERQVIEQGLINLLSDTLISNEVYNGQLPAGSGIVPTNAYAFTNFLTIGSLNFVSNICQQFGLAETNYVNIVSNIVNLWASNYVYGPTGFSNLIDPDATIWRYDSSAYPPNSDNYTPPNAYPAGDSTELVGSNALVAIQNGEAISGLAYVNPGMVQQYYPILNEIGANWTSLNGLSYLDTSGNVKLLDNSSGNTGSARVVRFEADENEGNTTINYPDGVEGGLLLIQSGYASVPGWGLYPDSSGAAPAAYGDQSGNVYLGDVNSGGAQPWGGPTWGQLTVERWNGMVHLRHNLVINEGVSSEYNTAAWPAAVGGCVANFAVVTGAASGSYYNLVTVPANTLTNGLDGITRVISMQLPHDANNVTVSLGQGGATIGNLFSSSISTTTGGSLVITCHMTVDANVVPTPTAATLNYGCTGVAAGLTLGTPATVNHITPIDFTQPFGIDVTFTSSAGGTSSILTDQTTYVPAVTWSVQ